MRVIVAKAVDEIAKEFPQMAAELEAQNQVYLATGVVLDTYQIFSTEPISSLKDIEGKKVAGAGFNLRYLEGLGAAGVRGGLTDFYNMLQTGVVDQAMLWPEAAMTFKISEVAPHMLQANLGAVNSKTVTINKDVWEKLPEEVQTILRDVAVAYRDHVAEVAMARAADSVEKFEAAGGTVVELSAEERKAWGRLDAEHRRRMGQGTRRIRCSRLRHARRLYRKAEGRRPGTRARLGPLSSPTNGAGGPPALLSTARRALDRVAMAANVLGTLVVLALVVIVNVDVIRAVCSVRRFAVPSKWCSSRWC